MHSSHWQVTRIALALAAIFFFGFATGRFTNRRPDLTMTGGRGQIFDADTLLARELQAVQLTPDQVRALRPVMERMVADARGTPPRSRQRVEVLMKFAPEIRKHLRPEQVVTYDRWLEERRQRFERILLNRERQRSNPR